MAKEKLSDWKWRINNLYWITDKKGKKIRFKMNAAQEELFDNFWYRNLVLKARQLGFTTFVLILMLDACLFRPNTRCALIAHSIKAANRLFREKVKFAYENLPDQIKTTVSARNDTAGEYVFNNGSSITVDTGFRGGTLRYLHISEFGKICRLYPDKAEEIVTGAIEAVGDGCVATIESTAEGRSGYFYQYATEAEKLMLSGAKLNPMEWKFFFFPWWRNPEYSMDDPIVIPTRLEEYFYELEIKHGIKLRQGQKNWYVAKEKNLGEKMKREHPSIPKEAFEQSIEGAFYARQFREIYEQKRICKVPYDQAAPVHTAWDIGIDDSTAIWFFQRIGREWHIIDYYECNNEGLSHYIDLLEQKRQEFKYRYGIHLGPHDMRVREFGADGKTRWQQAKAKGIEFTIAPSVSLADGIEATRALLSTCWFDEAKTDAGLSHLQNYSKKWDDKNGVWLERPLHNEASHASDAFRELAVSTDLIDNHFTNSHAAPISAPVETSCWV